MISATSLGSDVVRGCSLWIGAAATDRGAYHLQRGWGRGRRPSGANELKANDSSAVCDSGGEETAKFSRKHCTRQMLARGTAATY